ncbi:phage regulatory protein/antirepressor Ant [Psychrobacter sp. UBA3068]|uniref:phage regulatory protein/antirepressor Ant n=1 Tax=Psychrobacter sp. UBA3068 TaxID=1947349 RepID=UPI00257DCE82|nr:phage regulatory protein/antirepressor Ant [Psychrobacter sp. UBA3068]|tara:strand:+ start:211 stop:945 length:735 start_codon:yes stop_codon:yes gene_type:complete
MSILTQNIKTMSSREIAEHCDKDHRNVCRDIDSLNESYAQMALLKVEQSDYVADNGQSYRQYLLSKEQTIDLITGYRADIRIRINRRWAELEQQAAQPVVALPQDYLSALKALVTSEEAKERANAEIKQLQPKAAALDAISHAKGSTGIRETAKAVGMGQNEFVAWCTNPNKPASARFMYRDHSGALNAYSHRIDQGFVTQKLSCFIGGDGRDRTAPKVRFTPSGVTQIAKLLQQERSRELEAV